MFLVRLPVKFQVKKKMKKVRKHHGWAGEMVQQAHVFAARPDHLSAFPGPTSREERTDSDELLSDLRMCAVPCAHTDRSR